MGGLVGGGAVWGGRGGGGVGRMGSVGVNERKGVGRGGGSGLLRLRLDPQCRISSFTA